MASQLPWHSYDESHQRVEIASPESYFAGDTTTYDYEVYCAQPSDEYDITDPEPFDRRVIDNDAVMREYELHYAGILAKKRQEDEKAGPIEIDVQEVQDVDSTSEKRRELKPMPSAFTERTMLSSPMSTAHDVETGLGSERGVDQVVGIPAMSTMRSVLLVLVCTMGMIINIASTTAVTIALPIIEKEFKVEQGQLQWLVSAYALSSGCLLILFGRLADLHGKKKAFLIGVTWLGIFSIACGAVNNILTLDVLRGLQGIGAAAYIPASLGILAEAFPPSRARSIAFSTFSAGAPVGGAVGQQLGGLLIQYTKATWRSPFFLMAGLAALTVAGGWYTINPDVPNTEADQRVDWLGAFLVTTGLVLVTFVLGQGQLAPKQWQTPYIIVLIIFGVAILLIFGWWQYYLEKNEGKPNIRPPIMKLSLWKRANGKFAVVQIIAFLEWAAYISWGFWSLLFNQDYAGLSPVESAIRLLPTAIVGIAANVLVAFVIGRVDMVYLVVFGTIMTGIAGLLFAVINPAATYWAFGFPAACTSVFGVDFVFASGTLFVAKVSLPHEQSLSGGLFQTLTQLGTAVGLAVTTIINGRVLQDQSRLMGVTLLPDQSNAPRDAQLKAYQAAQWGVFAFAALGAILAVIFLRGIGIVGEQKNKPIPDSHSETTVVPPHSAIPPITVNLSEKSFEKSAVGASTSKDDGRKVMQTIQIQAYLDANGVQRWSIVR